MKPFLLPIVASIGGAASQPPSVGGKDAATPLSLVILDIDIERRCWLALDDRLDVRQNRLT